MTVCNSETSYANVGGYALVELVVKKNAIITLKGPLWTCDVSVLGQTCLYENTYIFSQEIDDAVKLTIRFTKVTFGDGGVYVLFASSNSRCTWQTSCDQSYHFTNASTTLTVCGMKVLFISNNIACLYRLFVKFNLVDPHEKVP